LKSNNLIGTYEYPDFPLDGEKYGVKQRQHLPGSVIHAYHEEYAKHFGIFDLIRFKTRVVSAEHQPNGGWELSICKDFDVHNAEKSLPVVKLFTRRLIVATGLTSDPFLPHFEGQETYGAPLFHARDFLKHKDTVDPTKVQRVTVFGGSKSAWDAVYAYGTKGVPVDWVIRGNWCVCGGVWRRWLTRPSESGHGSCWMAPPFVTPLKKWLEKLVSKSSPSATREQGLNCFVRYALLDLVQSLCVVRGRRIPRNSIILARHCRRPSHHKLLLEGSRW
jgi:hypothetical protein